MDKHWLEFFEKTRLRVCANASCQENIGGHCILKVIDINEQGKCKWFLSRKKQLSKAR